ncbi:MAG: hypothetical protein WD768_21505 [Phycisphaeraceae bacterium]
MPRALKGALGDHDVHTADDMGWSQLSNGELLREAAQHFDVFVTVDQKIKHQQNLAKLPLAIIVACVRSTRVEHMLAVAPAIQSALHDLTPRSLVEVRPSNDAD